jgi:hypothetical protein
MSTHGPESTAARVALWRALQVELRPILDLAAKGAQASGTPFLTFMTPPEMLAIAREAGLKTVRHISAANFGDLYFAGRPDGMRPPTNTEEMLVATVD